MTKPAAASTFALCLSLLTVPAEADDDSAAVRPPDSVYANACGSCHDNDLAPAILGRALKPDYIIHMVRNGPGAMPYFRPSEVSDAELKALSEWIFKSNK